MNSLSPICNEISANQMMIESCTAKFEKLKKKHSSRFEHPAIKEMSSEMNFPLTNDIETDDPIVRIVSTKTTPYLGTSGIASCFAVAGIGRTSDNEIYISLAHINVITPNEVLDTMTCAFIEKGCEDESIEFYIVGGTLPLDNQWGNTDSSFDKQKLFLSLAEEYNIKAVRFNLVRGDIDDLTVIMNEEGLFWEIQEDVINSTSHDSFDSSDETSSTRSLDSSDETNSIGSADSSDEASSTDSTHYSSEDSCIEESINSFDESDSESSTQEAKFLKRKIDPDSDDLQAEIKRKKMEHSLTRNI